MIRVKVFQEGELLHTVDLVAEDIIIGRESSAEIQLPSEAVSRRHARLRKTADGWEVADLGAANGVFVAKKGSGQPERVVLESVAAGDVIVIEKFSIRFKEIDISRPTAAAPREGTADDGFTNKRTQFISMVDLLDQDGRAIPAPSLESMPAIDADELELPEAKPNKPSWWARMTSASGHDRVFQLEGRTACVGTDPECAIRIPSGPKRLVELDRDGPTVSFHRVPRWPFPRVNVDGRSQKTGLLQDGDSLEVGDVHVTIHLDREPEKS